MLNARPSYPERDLWILSCGKKTTSDGLIPPPLLRVHNISLCLPQADAQSQRNRGGRVLDSSFKGLVLLRHETLFSGGDSPSCACPG